MRPRQSSLGIMPMPRTSRFTYRSFNEAEAIKPRNRMGRVVVRGHRQRFNEAEAIKPRNLNARAIPQTQTMASMRPRQSSLGIAPADFQGGRRSGASMRPRQSSLGILYLHTELFRNEHGFNEAEAIKPRNPSTSSTIQDRSIVASMRPRQSSLGISSSTVAGTVDMALQ